MKNERVYKMAFAKVYPLLVQKVEHKGRTKAEVDAVICGHRRPFNAENKVVG